jgi:hypothetical protein
MDHYKFTIPFDLMIIFGYLPPIYFYFLDHYRLIFIPVFLYFLSHFYISIYTILLYLFSISFSTYIFVLLFIHRHSMYKSNTYMNPISQNYVKNININLHIFYIFISLLCTVKYGFYKIYNNVFVSGLLENNHNLLTSLDNYTLGKLDYDTYSIRLIVIIVHGINANSSATKPIIDEFIKQYPSYSHKNILLFIPNLPNKGNISIDNSYFALANHIKNLCICFPNIPVCLIGISLGGVICIKSRFIIPETTKVYMCLIASPLLGSYGVSWHKERFSKYWLYSQDLLYQIDYNNKHLINNIEKIKKIENTSFILVACISDHLILPFHSSIPDLPNSEIIWCNYSGHLAIQLETAEEIVKKLKIKMNNDGIIKD